MNVRRRALIGTVGATYGLGLLTVGLWPRHVDGSLDLPGGASYAVLEFGANVGLFLPLAVLTMALLPRLGWHWVVIAGVVLSSGIEGLQAVVRPGRTPAIQDVVANSLGAALGALLVVGVRRWRRRHATRS